MIDDSAPLYAARRVLEAEALLAGADYAGAEAAYRAALRPDLPRAWRGLAHTRLALLRAAGDPGAALAELEASDAAHEPADASAEVWIAPLLPAANPDATQLAAALRAPPDTRAQQLGQMYLRARLYTLAEAQFASVAPTSAGAGAAAAYAAYTHWLAGDRTEGIRRLQSLAVAYPGDTRARALLALAYLATDDDDRARAELEVVRALAPRAPDTHMAWGQWHAAQHDYVAAAEAYDHALRDAPPEERGIYALALAQFHLDTSFIVCEKGRPAAEEAAQLRPDDARVWIALSATSLVCGDPAAARAAAEQALRQNPRDAEASYHLGRALAQLGQRAAARAALVNAADFAPASPWRERAEAQIATLGL
jgi:tetratricopeptide (TPR) repeat protein